jgi:hypothetical protein
MKVLRVIFLLILVALIWSGARKQSAVVHLQTEHETLVARATAIGLPERESDGPREPGRVAKRSTLAGKIPAADLKNELVSAYQRLKSLEVETDPETRLKVEEEVREWIGRLIDLSSKELKQVVNDLLDDASLAEKDRSALLSVVLSLASTLQSETAAELALAHRESGGDIRGIIRNWASLEPAGAFAWLEKNKEAIGKDYSKAWEEAVKQSASRDPALALYSLANMQDTKARERMAGDFAASLKDDSSRMAMLEEIRRSQMVHGVWGIKLWESIGNNLANGSPDSSAVVKGLSPGECELISGAVLTSGQSLNHAEAWLDWSRNSHLPMDPFSPVPPLLTRWINDDYQAAGEWINKQPAGEFRNAAAANYARMMAKRFPATARDWAATLPEGPEKRRLLEDLQK